MDEVDLSTPRHSQSILWGHASRNTLSNDQSTTQWIDGSVSATSFRTPNSNSHSYGKGKTPRSTYHERVEQSYSRPVLTPGGSATKQKKKQQQQYTATSMNTAISNSKTPSKSIIRKGKKSATRSKKKKKKKTTTVTKTPKRPASPQKHNFNNLTHISKGAYTDSASNLRWASELRTHEALASPSRTNTTTYNKRILESKNYSIGMVESSNLDQEVTELTKKLDAVSGKQVCIKLL
jgi:hypothetical protein